MTTHDLTLTKKYTLRVEIIRMLSPEIYVMRLRDRPFDFEPGQYLLLGFPGEPEKREYSIYSGTQDGYLEVLIREVRQGDLSRRFRQVPPGTFLEVEGPFGFFTLTEDSRLQHQYLFIASGTGISPFHSMVSSFPKLKYTLLHGIRYISDVCEPADYHPSRIITCTSRDPQGDFPGHVTDWIRNHHIPAETDIFLCGNSDMIHDAITLLTQKGHSLGKIHAEIYF